jgi:hypothetical protein
MKTILLIAMAMLAIANFGSEARASEPDTAPAPVAKAAADAAPVRQHVRHRHGHSYGGLFRHWCAYNCYAVPPCFGPSCYGRYGYSHFAYDEDIPFPHRWDRDASPVDNTDAFVYRYTGEPIIRAFERIY